MFVASQQQMNLEGLEISEIWPILSSWELSGPPAF